MFQKPVRPRPRGFVPPGRRNTAKKTEFTFSPLKSRHQKTPTVQVLSPRKGTGFARDLFWRRNRSVSGRDAAQGFVVCRAFPSHGTENITRKQQESPKTRVILNKPHAAAGLSTTIRTQSRVDKSEVKKSPVNSPNMQFNTVREFPWVRVVQHAKTTSVHGSAGNKQADTVRTSDDEVRGESSAGTGLLDSSLGQIGATLSKASSDES